jgi:O-antigen/teichoic acid export membrane protein
VTSSIRNRFAASFVANVLRSAVSFATGLLVARWMGPADYGRMAFLLASFVAFRQLLDMASSTAFFTFLSQRPRGATFIRHYWTWVALQFVLSIVAIAVMLPEEWVETLWKGESRIFVLLGFVAAFMQGTVWLIACQMAEASRQTIREQRLGTLVVLVHLGVVVALWIGGALFIPLIFAALALEWGLAAWFAARLYHGRSSAEAQQDTARSVWREFWQYCLPFMPYAALGFAHDFANRWMLQHWGGAVQQAYYAVAAQFAALALLATSSILQILWKEIAEAHYQNNQARVEALYRRACRFLYFVAAVVAGGLLPWAADILSLTVGGQYAGGVFSLSLMLIFVVHQSIGQISGTMLYATGRQRTQVLVGVFGMVASLIGAYIAMAPTDLPLPGLALGSEGLAAELVIVQILQVNLQVWLIAKVCAWKYDWTYQIVSIAVAVVAGVLARFAVTSVISGPAWLLMAIAAILHVGVAASVLWLLPRIAGVERSDFAFVAAKLRIAKPVD